MNLRRYLSPSGLSSWTFNFPVRSTGVVHARHESRDDIHREEWALVGRHTVSTASALRAIERLKKLGWKLG